MFTVMVTNKVISTVEFFNQDFTFGSPELDDIVFRDFRFCQYMSGNRHETDGIYVTVVSLIQISSILIVLL